MELTAEHKEDWYGICGGLKSIWNTDTVSVMDCRVYRGLVLVLW